MGSSGEHQGVDLCRKASGFKWIAKVFLANENGVVRKLRFGAGGRTASPSPSQQLMKLMKKTTIQSTFIPRSGFEQNFDDEI